MAEFQKLLDDLPALLSSKFDIADREAVSSILKTAAIRRALALVLFERSQIAASMINVDLSSEQGRLNATREQGRARGIQWAIEKLFDMTEEEENTDDDAE